MVHYMQINSINPNINTNKSSPSFKATIHWVNKREFAAIKAAAKDCFEVGNPANPAWIIEEAAVCKPVTATAEICDCIAGSFINPETRLGNMFHLTAWKMTPAKLAEVRRTIIEQARKLKGESKTPLEAALIGSKGNFSYIAQSEIMLREEMKRLFKEMADSVGMTYSMFVGRRANLANTSIISDARQNTHYIYYKNPDMGDWSKWSDWLNVIRLSRAFDTKALAPNDKLLIDGTDVTQKFRRGMFI